MSSNIPIPGQLYTNGDRVFEIGPFYNAKRNGHILVKLIHADTGAYQIWDTDLISERLRKLTPKETAFFLLRRENESNKVL